MLVHMYHEIRQPYEFLWNLRPALRAGGRVVVIDADRPTKDHGTPPMLLQCEFAVVGYRLVEQREAPFAGGYFAAFEATGKRRTPATSAPASWTQTGNRGARRSGGFALCSLHPIHPVIPAKAGISMVAQFVPCGEAETTACPKGSLS